MGVSHTAMPARLATTERFGRHDAEDRVMVAAARLVFDLALLTEEAGSWPMPRPFREPSWIYGLFERAVAGLTTWSCRRRAGR